VRAVLLHGLHHVLRAERDEPCKRSSGWRKKSR
jgi:hypothetical protein